MALWICDRAREPQTQKRAASSTCRAPLTQHPEQSSGVALSGSARREHDGVNHRDDAAFGLREAQPIEGRHYAAHHAAVRQIRTAVGSVGDCAVATDDETSGNATFEIRIPAEALLVAHTETTVILTNDTLDDFGRQTPAHGRRAHAHLRSLGLVRTAEALARTRTGSVAQRANVAQADALTATATALTDTGETEAARAEGVADFVAPHVTAGAYVVRTE